ncbi:hypothetical protein OYC64_020954 [Pagothenia borchgrevinki]|uniref:Caspase-8 n=1 Tax=Pagothenia borchgrevinki TaxID=8213 RepID=A0ABD2FNG4_PAGBO
MSEISEEEWKRDLKDGRSKEEMPGKIIKLYGKENAILEMERGMQEIPRMVDRTQSLLKPYVQKVKSKPEKQQHDHQPQMRDEDGQYELNSQPTGLCLIINNEHFSDGDVRRGTDKDAESLAKVFSWLGFRVLMCKDQTKNQMERVLVCFASQCDLSQLQEFNVKEWTRSEFTDLLEAPQHGDAFICCVLSHGNKGNVLGVDGQSLPIKQITRTFMATRQCPLKAKPKVFLIQACQGQQRHPGVLSDGVQADDSDSTLEADDSDSTSIPQEADILVHSSTVEDYYSIRDPTKGSWFIQSVCKQLEEGCQRNEEIDVILRRVNNEVAGKDGVLWRGRSCGPVKQMPEIRHTLRKRLVLTPHQNSEMKRRREKEPEEGTSPAADQLDRSQPVKKLKTRDSQDGKAPWEKSIFDLKSSGILETEAIVGKVVKKSELLKYDTKTKKGKFYLYLGVADETASVKLMVYGEDHHRQIKEGSSYIFRSLIKDGIYVKVNASSKVSETKPVIVPEEFEREAERLLSPELTSIKDIKSSPPQTYVSVEGTVTEIDPVHKVKVEHKEKKTNQQKFKLKQEDEEISVTLWGEATEQSKDLSVGDVVLLNNMKPNEYCGKCLSTQLSSPKSPRFKVSASRK